MKIYEYKKQLIDSFKKEDKDKYLIFFSDNKNSHLLFHQLEEDINYIFEQIKWPIVKDVISAERKLLKEIFLIIKTQKYIFANLYTFFLKNNNLNYKDKENYILKNKFLGKAIKNRINTLKEKDRINYISRWYANLKLHEVTLEKMEIFFKSNYWKEYFAENLSDKKMVSKIIERDPVLVFALLYHLTSLEISKPSSQRKANSILEILKYATFINDNSAHKINFCKDYHKNGFFNKYIVEEWLEETTFAKKLKFLKFYKKAYKVRYSKVDKKHIEEIRWDSKNPHESKWVIHNLVKQIIDEIQTEKTEKTEKTDEEKNNTPYIMKDKFWFDTYKYLDDRTSKAYNSKAINAKIKFSLVENIYDKNISYFEASKFIRNKLLHTQKFSNIILARNWKQSFNTYITKDIHLFSDIQKNRINEIDKLTTNYINKIIDDYYRRNSASYLFSNEHFIVIKKIFDKNIMNYL